MEPTYIRIFNNEFDYFEKHNLICKTYLKNECRTTLVNRILILYTNNESETPLTPFDKIVYNAICTLWDFKEKEFTIVDIYRLVNGNLKTKARDLNSTLYEEIINSLNKMQEICISLKCEEEQLNIEENLVSLEMKKDKINDKETISWKILSEPPLLQYAKLRRKIKHISKENFNTHLHATIENVLLRNYLIEQILRVNNGYYDGGRKSRISEECSKIRFMEIYKQLGINCMNNENKMRRKKVLNICKKLFDFWMNETKILECWKVDENNKFFEIKINYYKLPHFEFCDYIDIDTYYYTWSPEGYVDMNEIVDALQILAESGLGLEDILNFLEDITMEI